MKSIIRTTSGAALGLALTAAGLVPATAAQAAPELPPIPGATAPQPIVGSSTYFSTVQGVEAQSDRDGLRVFATGETTPTVQVTSTVASGTLEVLDDDGDRLCTGSATPTLPNLYSCDLATLVSGPATITAAVVQADGSYSTPEQVALDAYIDTPTVESATRKGNTIGVRGTANRGATIQASLDGGRILKEAVAGDDGTFTIVVPGTAQAEQVLVRATNPDIPADTPYHDAFAQSGWALAVPAAGLPGDGGEIVDPGEGGEVVDPGEGGEVVDPGDGGEVVDPGDGGEVVDPGEGGEVVDPGEGGEVADFTVDLKDGDTVERTAGQITVTGSGQPGGAVVVMHGQIWVGIADIGADGRWSLTGHVPVSVGFPLQFDYYTDIDGQRTSTEYRTIDTHDTESDQGPIEDAGFTVDLSDGDTVERTAGQITLTGTGQPGGAVVVMHGNSWVGVAEIGADGHWTLTGNVPAGLVLPLQFDYYADIDGQKTSTEYRDIAFHDTESDQ